MVAIEKGRANGSSPETERVPDGHRFLLLKGPFGPFFHHLANSLKVGGADVLKINFDGGDVLDWRNAGRWVRFVGDAKAWEPFIAGLLVRERVTDLLVFNDCLELHEIAIRKARNVGVRVHVFEEGYFRPDWITLERDGVNAFSALPRNPAGYADEPLGGEAPERSVGPQLPQLVRLTIMHYLGRYLLWPILRGTRSPFPYSVPHQAASYVSRYLTRRVRAIQAERQQQILLGHPPFFLALMQRSGDTQMSHHSDLDNMRFISTVILSFAGSAPVDTRLVFKLHPLEAGLFDYARIVRGIAQKSGVMDRVSLIDGGVLQLLARGSAGVVAINSTAALAAIGFGCPTITLGRAFYAMPGMTAQTGLDAFWRMRPEPDPHLYRRFRAAVMRRTQINGSFYTRAGWRMAMPAIVRKLLQD